MHKAILAGRKSVPYYEKAFGIEQEIEDRRGEGADLNNLGTAFKTKRYRKALACYLLAKKIRREIKDPNIKTTESKLSNLKALGENEFEKVVKEVEPAEEIVMKMVEGETFIAKISSPYLSKSSGARVRSFRLDLSHVFHLKNFIPQN